MKAMALKGFLAPILIVGIGFFSVAYFVIFHLGCDESERGWSLFLSFASACITCVILALLKGFNTKIVLATVGLLFITVSLFFALWLLSISTDIDKSIDASIKSQLNNLRASGELYYDDNNESYSGFCDSETVLVTSEFVREDGAEIRYRCGGLFWQILYPDIFYKETSFSRDFVCEDSATKWSGGGALPLTAIDSRAPAWYCVDSAGHAGVVERNPEGMTQCPQ